MSNCSTKIGTARALLKSIDRAHYEELNELREVIKDLVAQINAFAAKYGEADFETGKAEKALRDS